MNLTAEQRARLAYPGDPDLTFDLSGMLITGVIAEGRELLIHATGGVGFWYDDEGRVEFGPGAGTVEDIDFRAGYDDTMPDEIFDGIRERLYSWRDNATPVRVCACPDRIMVVIAAPDDWLPLAMTPPDEEP